jgi:glycosyltransferase involved in cell wall biosynthesis
VEKSAARLRAAGSRPELETKSTRVLITSHSDPRLSKGGAETAAYELFSALRERVEYEPWFMGCLRDASNSRLGTTFSQPYSEREYLYACGLFDWFKFSNGDPDFPREFRALLQAIKPRIAHFHHYLNIGVEAFLHVRETLPDCRIILTLHEYLGLCHHYGQMVTKQAYSLCYESSPMACNRCFKDIAPSDFFLRGLYIKRFFELVDHFIAPSAFLAERYIAWGLPRDRVSVIENITKSATNDTPAAEARNENALLRVGFFGQISVLKGINVLFDAAEILEKREMHNVVFEVHGDHTGQPSEFQTDFLARLSKAGPNVKFHGAYDQRRLDTLMQSVDVVIVPSIWWENSPVVIQEAFRNRCPVICSDIGGMAEQVRDGVDGFYFPVGNSFSLVGLLLQLVADRRKLAGVRSSMRWPPGRDEVTEQHIKLYADVTRKSAVRSA